MLKIDMLPAGYGDCLWVEYGSKSKPFRILIDGGISPTFETLRAKIETLSESERHFELLIITHVDADHIEGTIRLLGSVKTLGVSFGDIWFNGWKHLDAPDKLGGVQGEFLSALIDAGGHNWNKAFEGAAVVVPDEGDLPVFSFADGLTLTLLSPTRERLVKLKPKWNSEVQKSGLDRDSVEAVLAALEANRKLRPEDDVLGEKTINIEQLGNSRFSGDGAEANGSAIAILAEYNGKSVLLTGDAWSPILAKSIQRILDKTGDDRLKVGALKMPHHGSRANISTDLLDMLKCKKFLYSTNGKIFHHPDPEGVARVILHGGKSPSLFFNYRTEFTEVWDDSTLMTSEHPYTVTYPADEAGGLEIEL
jgi:beta-lactamase superfamily II metal-dependent hydrolase